MLTHYALVTPKTDIELYLRRCHWLMVSGGLSRNLTNWVKVIMKIYGIIMSDEQQTSRVIRGKVNQIKFISLLVHVQQYKHTILLST